MKEILKSLIDGVNPADLLPELDSIFSFITVLTRLAVLAAPVLLLILGAIYFFLPPKEANYSLGFRCWWGMSSVEVWLFTQKLSGAIWMGLGGILGIIALISSAGYGGLNPQEMMFKALGLIIWQLCLVVVSIVVINLVLIFKYDSKGNPRR